MKRKFIVIFKSQVSVRLIQLNRLLVKLEELGWGKEMSEMSPYERSNIYYTLSKNHELGPFHQG